MVFPVWFYLLAGKTQVYQNTVLDEAKSARVEALSIAILRHPHCSDSTIADVLYDAAALEHFINHGTPEGAINHVADLDMKQAERLGFLSPKEATITKIGLVVA